MAGTNNDDYDDKNTLDYEANMQFCMVDNMMMMMMRTIIMTMMMMITGHEANVRFCMVDNVSNMLLTFANDKKKALLLKRLGKLARATPKVTVKK